jgi:hypothetical protein
MSPHHTTYAPLVSAILCYTITLIVFGEENRSAVDYKTNVLKNCHQYKKGHSEVPRLVGARDK